MTVPRIGSATWRDASYQIIDLAHNLKQRPFTAVPLSKKESSKCKQDESIKTKNFTLNLTTPSLFHRDLVNEACNALARGYMRDTKHLMVHLRRALDETDRTIQQLQKMRNTLEHCHANTRKDILTNKETIQIRATRPKTESHIDKVDTLLKEEKFDLNNLKRYSEQQLHEVAKHLQILYSQRKKLYELCKEKNSVLELMNETSNIPSTRQESTGVNKLLNQDCHAEIRKALARCQLIRNTLSLNSSPYTQSRNLKERITKGLQMKANESVQIREDIILTLGETRNHINMNKRLRNELENSYISQLGPVSALDLSVREHLDRPLIKILQRHPGTQIPESALIIQGTSLLGQTLDRAHREIDFQQLTHSRLEDDAKNKLLGEEIDRTAVRMRNRAMYSQRK
ncbi:hypothetical protein GDO86_015563 [Hymenochirus boettgeri]|uniref:Coiled-coil domain-containing protein 105 n=1 Tax=Hymenochirus boettgeri TaxID=247094 RepID=A0A8T2JWZ2_9PIPI|nr:hypothetical protein GDO86_015563 [Hymenochirus boettgeri]